MPDNKNGISLGFKIEGHLFTRMFHQTNHSNCWGGIYRTFGVLVIKTNITPSNRGIKFFASLSHSFNGIYKLVIDLRIERISKVQAIGNTQWLTATANNIARSFRNSDHSTFI